MERLRVIENGKGERMVFLKTGDETGGELLEMEAHYRPNSPRPPEHFHPHQHERFEVRRRVYRACIGSEAGDAVSLTFVLTPAGAGRRSSS